MNRTLSVPASVRFTIPCSILMSACALSCHSCCPERDYSLLTSGSKAWFPASLCLGYASKFPDTVITKRTDNVGVSEAEIPGIRMCTTDYIALFAMLTTATPTAESKFSETPSPTTRGAIAIGNFTQKRNTAKSKNTISIIQVPELPCSTPSTSAGGIMKARGPRCILAKFSTVSMGSCRGGKVRRYRNHSRGCI